MSQERPGRPDRFRHQKRARLKILDQHNLRKKLAIGLVLLGSIWAVCGFLLHSVTGWIGLGIAVMGGLWVQYLHKSKLPSMGRPGAGEPGQ